MNNGQTCYRISTRVLAPRSQYGKLVEILAASFNVGDSLDPATQMGPMVSRAHSEHVGGPHCQRPVLERDEAGALLNPIDSVDGARDRRWPR